MAGFQNDTFAIRNGEADEGSFLPIDRYRAVRAYLDDQQIPHAVTYEGGIEITIKPPWFRRVRDRFRT